MQSVAQQQHSARMRQHGAPMRPRAPGVPVAPRHRVAPARALELPQPPAGAHESEPAAASRCPVLAALATPPVASVPWWRRFEQFTNPPRYQAEILARNEIVTTPAAAGLPEMVVPGRVEWMRQVMAREPELSRPAPLAAFGELLPQQMEGAEHEEFRSALAPAFTYDTVYRTLRPTIVAAAEQCLENAAAAGGEVSGNAMFKRLTFQVIMNVMMGKEYAEAEMDKLQALYNTFLAGMFKFPLWNLGPLNAYGRALIARRQLLEIFEKDVAAARARAARGEEVPGQLGMMLEAMPPSPKNDAKLQDVLLSLLFAGHDTTSTALTSLFATLPSHPGVMAKLREEQAQLVARHGPGASAALLKDMKYGDAVVRESMRYSPIATQLSRTAARDFEMGGYKVKEGSTILLPLYSAARADPRWAGAEGDLSPDAFNPDRFLQPGAAKSECQMPFGHGGRYCLGAHLAVAEVKVFMALFFQGYDADFDVDTEWTFGIGRMPVNGLPMRVRKLEAPAAAA